MVDLSVLTNLSVCILPLYLIYHDILNFRTDDKNTQIINPI